MATLWELLVSSVYMSAFPTSKAGTRYLWYTCEAIKVPFLKNMIFDNFGWGPPIPSQVWNCDCGRSLSVFLGLAGKLSAKPNEIK
jgi:hypothetical protein